MSMNPQASSYSTEQIYIRLREIAQQQLSLPEGVAEAMRPETPIIQGLQLDSLGQVTLSAAIEDEFGVVLEPEDQEQIQTVEDLTNLIYARVNRSVN